MDTLNEISGTISSLMGPIGILLLGLVILMGTAYKSGKVNWLNIIKDLRRKQGKPNIVLVTESPSIELPWKDTGLLHGGIITLESLGFLFLYIGVVVFFSAWLWTDKAFSAETFWKILAFAMIYPVVVDVLGALLISWIHIKALKLPIHFFVGTFLIEITCIIFSWQAAFHMKPPELAFAVEILVFAVASLNLGFHLGMRDAIKESDIEMRYPEVSVLTDKGIVIDHLRLYERTNTDYRFVSNDGTNYIFPNSKIFEIRHSQETEVQSSAARPQQKDSKRFISSTSKSSPTKRTADGGDSAPPQVVSTPQKTPAPKQHPRPSRHR
jgi:hypothetical protein